MPQQVTGKDLTVRHRGGEETAEAYKGIPIHAAPGVHAAVAEQVRRTIGDTGRVLDLGAGQGALSQRLADIGYDVVAVDLSDGGWAATSVACTVIDLDTSWAPLQSLGPFDAVCAVEVIEHIENPRDFLRQILRLPLADGAPVVVTTPNPLDTFSCITLFTRGWFNWFSPAHYSGGGHISILPFWMVDMHLLYLGQSACEWRYEAPFRHRRAMGQAAYNVITALRGLVSKSSNRKHFDGVTAVGTFRASPSKAET